MTYDSKRGVTVMFGGQKTNGALAYGTFEWDGTTWTDRTMAVYPPARCCSSIAFDTARGRTVLFGGQTSGGNASNETWEWDGTSWLQAFPQVQPLPSTQPPTLQARWSHAVAYDAARREIVMFGGSNGTTFFGDTWTYAPRQPANFTAFGSGCATTGPVPSLTLASGALPWIGDTVTIEVDNAGAFPSSPYLMLGVTRVSPPLNLGLLGLPNCALHVSPTVVYSMSGAGTTATLPLGIPLNPWLSGRSIYVQGASFTGLAPTKLSNAAELTLGAR